MENPTNLNKTSKLVAVASPNIAFIKYWGKLGSTDDKTRNLATNDSLSLTLSRARTETSVHLIEGRRQDSKIIINHKAASAADEAKVLAHVERVCAEFSLDLGALSIESTNNFPSGAGIASSASAFAALTLALLGAALGRSKAEQLLKTDLWRMSALARRGSGSACRSVAGPFMKWQGTSAHVTGPTDWKLRDTILVISSQHKSVPSTEGHRLATSSPRFAERLQQIPKRMALVEAALARRDLQALGPILEQEALELHEIAETSHPPVHYRLEETRQILQAIQELPKRDFFFTLDAGPNVHVISERPIKKDLESLLKNLGLRAEIWEDEAGFGPTFELQERS